MKRQGNFFPRIVEKENLYLAYCNASKGKHNRQSVQKIEADLDNKIEELHENLLAGKVRTSAYHTKQIFEPKERIIYILPFWPDRVVQHAILNILEPYWEKLFIKDSYSCIKNRGQHEGSKRNMQFVRHYKYVYKADIHHFYPSLNHDVLKQIIRKKVKDEPLLLLLDDIIDSVPGDTNVPIGNLMSQWYGNLYLNELDFFVKQELRCKAYIRYCDDFLLYSNSKEELREWKNKVEAFVAERLLLEFSKSDIFPTARGVDFLGYRHFPEGYLLVRKSTAKRMKRKLTAVRAGMADESVDPEYARGVVESAYGWASWANSYNFMEALRLQELRKEVVQYAELFGSGEETADQ
ncbi:MAG: reverse transcriptase/maturase family protein [Clostridiales bacterium]|nr:reverse transcriptase/maturase family protein [Clostridiales bacterium]